VYIKKDPPYLIFNCDSVYTIIFTILLLYLLYKMALTNCIKINIANNAKLYTNTQYVFTLIYTIRPKNISLVYNPKQKEFKLKRA
jgi:hypothetical protein